MDECQHCKNLALQAIEEVLIVHGKQSEDVSLPAPNRTYFKWTEEYIDCFAEKQRSEIMQQSLNSAQQTAYKLIMAAVENENVAQRQ